MLCVGHFVRSKEILHKSASVEREMLTHVTVISLKVGAAVSRRPCKEHLTRGNRAKLFTLLKLSESFFKSVDTVLNRLESRLFFFDQVVIDHDPVADV